ncbi:MATE family efflux transporter [Pseudochelatococcus sp. B33]
MRMMVPEPLDLGSPGLRRLIVRLALPAVAGLSINALHHLANAAFLGILGAVEVAAVSFVFPLAILIAAFGEAIGVGTAALVSRLLGARRQEEASRGATMAVAMAMATGLAVTGAVLLFLTPILQALGATPAAFSLAHDYATLLAIGATLTIMQIVADFIAIAEGNTRFSMLTLIGCFAVNIVLDPIFIFVFGWGVPGAAAAMLVAQILVMIVWFIYFSRDLGLLRVRFSQLRGSARALWKEVAEPILAIGAPAGLASIVSAVTFMLIYRTAGAYGDESVAGLAIALRLLAAGVLPVAGFCIGAQGVLGYAIGNRDYARVREALGFMVQVTGVFALAYAAIMIAGAGLVVSLFSSSIEVQAVAARALVAVHLFFAFFGLQMVLVVLLRANGRTRLAALVTLAPQGYLLLPLVLLLPGLWGLDGLMAAPAVAAAAASLLAAGLLVREMRLLARREADVNGPLTADAAAR